MGKRLKELCRSRLAQFLTVQSMIAMEIVQFAFCSDAGTAYASVRRELYVPLRRFANMGISIAMVVGITSLILYVSSSNEKNAEKLGVTFTRRNRTIHGFEISTWRWNFRQICK